MAVQAVGIRDIGSRSYLSCADRVDELAKAKILMQSAPIAASRQYPCHLPQLPEQLWRGTLRCAVHEVEVYRSIWSQRDKIVETERRQKTYTLLRSLREPCRAAHAASGRARRIHRSGA